ncbi:hypothetical protein B0H11DRAFT_1904148 [Mycena galericulata]|nr:hypothetical protein B0H11DRAFT_1904148 [Mycena galericulata]
MCIDLEAWISAKRYAVSVNVWAGNAKIMFAMTGRHLEVVSVYPNQPLEEGPSVDCRFWMGKERKKRGEPEGRKMRKKREETFLEGFNGKKMVHVPAQTLICDPWGKEEHAGIGNLTHQLRLSLPTQGVERSMLSFTTQGVERCMPIRRTGYWQSAENEQMRRNRGGKGPRGQVEKGRRSKREGERRGMRPSGCERRGKREVRRGRWDRDAPEQGAERRERDAECWIEVRQGRARDERREREERDGVQGAG